ncbi:ParA family protein [Kribbella sp. CA-247076]|uniref:ParA family protein n=1 Tax=Kribbella sp. CA-247076 TaxID=3239941 RepID=UPI003D900173
MTKVVTFVGEGGKTTCAVGCAEAFRQAGLRVLLADTTPDQAAASWQRLAGWQVPVLARGGVRADRDHWAAIARDEYDVVVVDTAPTAGYAGRPAPILRASTDLVVVLTPSWVDLDTVGARLATYAPPDRRSVVLLNQVVPGASASVREAVAAAGWAVSTTELPLSEVHARAYGRDPGTLAAAFTGFAAALITTWREPFAVGVW